MRANFDTHQDSSEPSELIFFPGGVVIPKHVTPSPLHLKALSKLAAGQTKAVRLEKLHHKYNLYSLRASKGARIIGLSESGQFKVIALYDKHQYKRLKLINITGVQHAILDLDELSDETQVINQSLNVNYWRKGHFINSQAIFFSDVQEHIINTKDLPRIVSGAAGSGKTLIIIKRLVNAYLSGNLRTVYVAPTLELAQHAQKLFSEMVGQLDAASRVEQPNASFLSVAQFIELHKPEHSVLVDKKSILLWLKEQKIKSKTTRKLLADPEKILEEFKIIAVVTKKAYVKLGTQQSLYASDEEKNACFDLYELYEKKHPNHCQMVFPSLKKDKHYDELIIDEVQSFTLKQVFEITQCAIKGMFLVFGDPLQKVAHNRVSIFPQLKQHVCEVYRIQDPIIILPTTYRNPRPVREFANSVMRVRRLLMGGINDKCETIKLIAPQAEDPDALPVEWIDTLDEAKRQELTILLNEPNSMVITGSEESRLRADELFNNPTILFAEHALGLEASTVLVYCIFTPELIKRINKYLQGINLDEDNTNLPKKNQGTHEFTSDLERLFTAVTRVTQAKGRLIVHMGDALPKHDCELFFSLLTQSVTNKQQPPRVVLKVEEHNTVEQWQQWVKKLYESGNTKEAYRLFCKHLNTGDEDYNQLVGKKPSLPEAQTPVTGKPIVPDSTKVPVVTSTAAAVKATQKEQVTRNQKNKSSSPAQQASPAVRPIEKLKFFKSDLIPKSAQMNTSEISMFSEKEIVYLNNLLISFHPRNVTLLLKHRRVDALLFKPFKIGTTKKVSTLYTMILQESQLLAVFNQVIMEDRFLATGKILKASIVMTQLIEVISSVVNTLAHPSLVSTQLSHAKGLIALLELLIIHKPGLTEFITREHLRNGIFDCLTGSGPQILYKIILINPELIKEFIDLLIITKSPSKWYLSLMASQIGAATLVKMYEINPNIVYLVNGDALNERAKNSQEPIPIYFWLSTTIKGQLFLDMIMPKNAVTMDALSQPIKSCNPYYNGTNSQFWFSATTPDTPLDLDLVARAKKSSIPQEYTGLNYPGSFCLSGPELETAQLVLDLPPDQLIGRFDIISILNCKNPGELLFDYVNGATYNLFSRIAKRSMSISFFLNALNMKPECYKIFTIERLNQEVVTVDDYNKVFVESVLFTLVNEDFNFLTNLFKFNPEIKAAFDSELFVKTTYIHFDEKKRYNLLRILTTNINDISELLLLDSKIVTPEFAAESFRIERFHEDDVINSGFPFLNIFWVDPDKAYQLIEKCPQMLNYFTEEHLYLLSEKHLRISEQLDPKLIHYLCQSPAGIKIMLMLLESTPEILNNLTPEDFIEEYSTIASILMLLCLSNGYVLFIKMITLRPDLLLHITFSHLMADGQTNIPNKKFMLFEFLCHWADHDNPQILEFLVKNINFMKSINPEILLSRPRTTFHRLCNKIECVKVFEEICHHHPTLCKGLTTEMFFEKGTCLGNKSMFQSLFEIYQPEIKSDTHTILRTIFSLNPSLIDLPKGNSLSFIQRLERAIDIQNRFLTQPGFFTPVNRSVEKESSQSLDIAL